MEWFTAADISKLTGLSIRYIYNLAWENGWRRSNTKPRRYHIHDVFDSLKTANTRPE